MFNKKFTLIELIASVIVISILAVIVFATVGSLKNDSIRSAVASNINGLQIASDRYKTDGNNDSIGVGASTIQNPKIVDLNKVVPKYIKKDPKVGKYWVDYNDVVWGSTINPPNVSKTGNTYTWKEDKKTMYNNVYEVNRNSLKKVNNKSIEDNKFLGETSKEYVFTAVDELDLETVPVGVDYVVGDSDDADPGICTVKTIAGKYSPNDIKTKHEMRNVRYNNIIMDKEGNYVAIGHSLMHYQDRSAIVIDKYDKNLKLIGSTSIPSYHDFAYRMNLVEDKAGNYIITADEGFRNLDITSFNSVDIVNLPLDTAQKILAENRGHTLEESVVVIKFSQNLDIETIVKTEAIEYDNYFVSAIDHDGNFLLVEELNSIEQINLVRFDQNLEVMKVKAMSSFDLGTSTGKTRNIQSSLILKDGHIVISAQLETPAYDYYGLLVSFNEDFDVDKSYVLKETVDGSSMGTIIETSNGDIIALANYSEPVLLKFNDKLDVIKSVNFNEEYFEPWSLVKDGNNYTIKVNMSFQTFDDNLNLVKKVSLENEGGYETSLFNSLKMVKDNGSYIVISPYTYANGIVKVENDASIDLINWPEVQSYPEQNIPRVFHTLPPVKELILNHDRRKLLPIAGEGNNIETPEESKKSYIAGYDFMNKSVNPIYANSLFFNDDNVYIVETNGTLTSYTWDNIPDHIVNGTVASYYFDMGMDIIILDMGNPPANAPVYIEKAYRAGYNAENNSVNPIYANSGFVSGETMFVVESNGTLTPYPFENLPETIISNLVAGYFFDINSDKLILQMGVAPANAPIYDKGSPTGPIEETKGEKVDPCYAGSFITKISDLKIYKVENDGSLSLIGNPYEMSEEEIGYDIWKDSLFYLYSDGVIVDFPEVKDAVSHE